MFGGRDIRRNGPTSAGERGGVSVVVTTGLLTGRLVTGAKQAGRPLVTVKEHWGGPLLTATAGTVTVVRGTGN
jgi:hypothetical protein